MPGSIQEAPVNPDEIRAEWIRVGLATGPTDRGPIEHVIRQAYQAAGLAEPDSFVWVPSPVAGMRVYAALRSRRHRARLRRDHPALAQLPRRPGRLVRRRFMPAVSPSDIDQSVHEAVWERVGGPILQQARAAMGDLGGVASCLVGLLALASPIVLGIAFWIWFPVLGTGLAMVACWVAKVVAFLIAVLLVLIGVAVVADVDTPLPNDARFPEQAYDPTFNRNAGFFTAQHSAGVWAGHSIRVSTSGDRPPPMISALMTVARHAGWWWPFARVAVICERPTRLERDERGRLHSATGPAVEYPDGWKVWAWHGVLTPPEAIVDRGSLDWGRVSGEPDIAVRRALLERYGFDRVAREGRFDVVDEDRDALGRPRRLLRLTLPDEPLVVVEVVNPTAEPDGTHRTFYLRVPPQTRTAAEAVAWTFGLTSAKYRPLRDT